MKTDRMLKMIYICLQRERVTIRELASKLDVSRRTVFRDLETLSASGIPIVTYPGAGGGVGILESYKLDRSLLTDDDFSKLTTALKSIHSVDGNKDVELLMEKLIPPEKRQEDGSDMIIDLSSWFENDETDGLFADVRKAIAKHRYTKLGYSAKGMMSTRTVEPYKLVFKYHDWYLYAYCLMREDFRLFKLTRITEYSLSDDTFVPRKLGQLVFQFQGRDEQPEPTSSGPPVEVVLAYRAANKDDLLDAFGVQNFHDDDGQIRLTTTNLPWLTDLVMSLQDKVKVLKPAVLQDEVRKRIEQMKEVYER